MESLLSQLPSSMSDYEVFSLSEIVESKNPTTGLGETSDCLYIFTSEDGSKFQQNEYREIELSSLEFTEISTDFSVISNSNGNNGFHLSDDQPLIIIQNGESLDFLTIAETDKLVSTSFANISAKDICENTGFAQRQKDDDLSCKHQNSSEATSRCDSIDDTFTKNGELPLSNPIAGPSIVNAKVHWHAKQGQFVCPVCEKGFRRIDGFIVHYRHHTGEKPFRCNDCGKRFVVNYHLTRHLQLHTDQRPFACDKCEKRFGQKYQLTSHYRTHTGEKPYKCPICGKVFGQVSDRNRHRKKVHSKKDLTRIL